MTTTSIKQSLKTLFTGQLLLIKTEKELLIGNLRKVDIHFDFIIMESVRDVKNNIDFTSQQLIPSQTILYLETLNSDNDDSKSNETFKTVSEYSSATSNATSLPTVILSEFELQLLQKQLESLIILRRKDVEYHKAIADIRVQQVIAFSSHHRSAKTSFVTIATVSALYFFDILAFKNLPNEITNILKSERPRKALYSSHLIIDHFQHEHNVHINGVFDINASYCSLFDKNSSLELKDMVEQYFNDSDNILKSEDDFNYYDCFHRPLENELIEECAKRVFYILKLQEYLEKETLSSFYEKCAKFSRIHADCEDRAEIASAMVEHARSGINISKLDLNN